MWLLCHIQTHYVHTLISAYYESFNMHSFACLHACSYRGLMKRMRFLDYKFDKPLHPDQRRDFIMVSANLYETQPSYENLSIVYYICSVL